MAVCAHGLPPHDSSLWKMVAFASRYGHQQVPTLLAMTTNMLRRYVRELGRLIEDEAAAVQRETDR